MYQWDPHSQTLYYSTDSDHLDQGHVIQASGYDEGNGWNSDNETIDHAVPMAFASWVGGLEPQLDDEDSTGPGADLLSGPGHAEWNPTAFSDTENALQGYAGPVDTNSQVPMNLTSWANTIGQPHGGLGDHQSMPALVPTSTPILAAQPAGIPTEWPRFSLIKIRAALNPYIEAQLQSLPVPNVKYFFMNVGNVTWNHAFTKIHRQLTRLQCEKLIKEVTERQVAIDPKWELEEGVCFFTRISCNYNISVSRDSRDEASIQ